MARVTTLIHYEPDTDEILLRRTFGDESSNGNYTLEVAPGASIGFRSLADAEKAADAFLVAVVFERHRLQALAADDDAYDAAVEGGRLVQAQF